MTSGRKDKRSPANQVTETTRACRSDGEGSRSTSRQVAEDFAGSQGKATAGEARWWWLEDEPQVSVRGLLEQGPTATEEAASLADR